MKKLIKIHLFLSIIILIIFIYLIPNTVYSQEFNSTWETCIGCPIITGLSEELFGSHNPQNLCIPNLSGMLLSSRTK